ncbi:hypothetical protein [Aquamicrobium segne]|uniref:hypothetical protein n=1 Tax=Aquamicrobium segne TaxID=469547 RepID=UPI00366D56EF
MLPLKAFCPQMELSEAAPAAKRGFESNKTVLPVTKWLLVGLSQYVSLTRTGQSWAFSNKSTGPDPDAGKTQKTLE